jgi:3-oxoadipate CoA-transferase, beta subunit
VSVPGRSVDEMARRIAVDIEPGWCVNLGIGLPTAIGPYLDQATTHSENGILGMVPAEGDLDGDLINASKEPVGIGPGGSFFDHAFSFGLIRAGYIDASVMGAFQVSGGGDLANWSTGDPAAIPAVGGAMDLAVGAKRIFVMMRHVTKTGEPRLVAECTYPLTAAGVVSRIYTDLAVIDVDADGFLVTELAEGVDAEQVRAATGAPVRFAVDLVDRKGERCSELS